MVTAGAAMDAVAEATGEEIGADVAAVEGTDTTGTTTVAGAEEDTIDTTIAAAEAAETDTTTAAGITTTGTVIAVTDPAAAARATVGAALAPGRGAPLVIVTVPTALLPEAVAGRKGTTIAAEAEMIVDIPIVAVIGVTEDTTVVDTIEQSSVGRRLLVWWESGSRTLTYLCRVEGKGHDCSMRMPAFNFQCMCGLFKLIIHRILHFTSYM